MAPHHPLSRSSFEPFVLHLSNGAETTGLVYVPPSEASHNVSRDTARPLIVGLHGGTCTAAFYDVSHDYSAGTFAAMTSIPFVSLDRPCYGGSTSLLPLQEHESFFAKTGQWLHNFILPALWVKFGSPNNCTGMVLLSHSMAVPPTITCAGLHAQHRNVAAYPLAGIILSGWGTEHSNRPPKTSIDRITGALRPQWPGVKLEMMLGNATLACYHPSLLHTLEQQESLQNVDMPAEEGAQVHNWLETAAEHCSKVVVPTLYAMGENDGLWIASAANVQTFASLFVSSPKVEARIVLGAPHALEWGKMSYGWYLQCFGWASEVCALSNQHSLI